MSFVFLPQVIPEIVLIKSQFYPDERGRFGEIFKTHEFKNNGIHYDFVQDNYSHSQENVLRGLHYQKDPHSQGKLISVLRGKVFDVVVDIRLGSPTFGKSMSLILDAESNNMLWIPPGFAHGFCVLTPSTDFFYKCTAYYEKKAERGIHWNDPQLNIAWPLTQPLTSEKDNAYPFLENIPKEDLFEYKSIN